MNCKEFEKLGALDLSEDLSPGQVARLRSHTITCAACREFADGMRSSQAAVEGWRAAVPSEDLMAEMRRNVLAQVAETRLKPTPLERLLFMLRKPRFLFAGTLAAAGMIGIVLWLARPEVPSGTGTVRDNGPAGIEKSAPPPVSREARAEAPQIPATRPRTAEARMVVKPARPKASVPGSPKQPDTARAGRDASEQVMPVLRRIELQTADPNIRIIWLVQQQTQKPLPKGPRGG